MAEGLDRLLGRALAAFEVGDVAGEADVPLADFLRRALRAGLVEYCDARPVLREQADGGEADPAGACRA